MDVSLLSPATFTVLDALFIKGENVRAELKEVFCNIYLCPNEKELSTCFDRVYPCEKCDKRIFSEGFIKWMRKKLLEN